MRELNAKFNEWSLKDETHLRRQLNLIGRLVANERNWLIAIYKHAPYAVEGKVDFSALYQELGDIFDETRELFCDLAEDKEELVKVLELMEKEIGKLEHGIPRHRIKKAS